MQAWEQLTLHSHQAVDRGQDMHMQAAPSQAEALMRNFKAKKAAADGRSKEAVLAAYGSAAAEAGQDEARQLAQTDSYVEYNAQGRVIKGQAQQVLGPGSCCAAAAFEGRPRFPTRNSSLSNQQVAMVHFNSCCLLTSRLIHLGERHTPLLEIDPHICRPPAPLLQSHTWGCHAVQARSRYEENVFPGNHTSVWGSWWKDGQWGFACCHQTLKQSYCTGEAGRRAEAMAEQRMADNLAARAQQLEGRRQCEAAQPSQVPALLMPHRPASRGWPIHGTC